MDTSTRRKVIESFIILIYKQGLVELLDDDADLYTLFDVSNYLLDRPKIDYKIFPRYVSSLEADICGNCLTYFGHTVGGRLREGCHICQNSSNVTNRRLGNFCRLTGLMFPEASALIASTLYKYNIIGTDLS